MGFDLGFQQSMRRREGDLGDTVLELGEHSVMLLTCSLEKSTRKTSFDTHCLANYLHISGSADGSQAEFFCISRGCAGRLLLEWCRRVLVFLHLKLFFSPVC